MNRIRTLTAVAVLLGAVGSCRHESGGGPNDILTLWEERPTPPPGTTIGVFVQTSGAPAGTVVLDSREARICTLPANATAAGRDAGTSTADAGSDACPFEQRLEVGAGDQRSAVILVPLSASVPPLLAASLLDQTGAVVATVLRRFYPSRPATDANASSDDAGLSDDAGAASTPTADADADGGIDQ